MRFLLLIGIAIAFPSFALFALKIMIALVVISLIFG